MIDNIKLYFAANAFKGNFEKCRLREKKESRKEWTLRNPRNNAHISVWQHSNGVVTLKGSLRKWYYGDFSTKDLTLSHFIDATKQIVELLNVPLGVFNKAKISQTEIGLNVPISIPFSELSNKIVAYGTHRKKNVLGKGTTQDNYGTAYFGEHKQKNERGNECKHECEFRLKIYDKSKEIADKDIFSEGDTSYDILRIEFTLDDKDTFKRKGLPQIADINSLIKHWGKLYELWAEEVGRIVLLNNISECGDMDLKDVLCAETLNIYSWEDSIKTFKTYINEHYQTQNSKNSAMTKIYKRINNLLDNYSCPNEYCKLNFYKDIIHYLVDLKSNGEKVSVPLMVALLHSNTRYISKEEFQDEPNNKGE